MTAALRPATDDDVEDIRRWRNHPSARAVSFTQHEISPAEHRAWWSAVRDDPSRRVLVYEYNGVAAGSVTYTFLDTEARTAKWGCALDVDGLGRDVLPAWLKLEGVLIDYAFDTLGLSMLGGEVLLENKQVWQLHKRFGFTEAQRYTQEIDGVAHEVLWMELTAAARESARESEKGKRRK